VTAAGGEEEEAVREGIAAGGQHPAGEARRHPREPRRHRCCSNPARESDRRFRKFRIDFSAAATGLLLGQHVGSVLGMPSLFGRHGEVSTCLLLLAPC